MAGDASSPSNPLRACHALAHVSPDALDGLVAAGEERRFAAGDALIKQGDPGNGLLILLEGDAHAVLHSRDGEHVLGQFTGGDLVGEMALVTRKPRSADVIADTDVRTMFVPTEAFDRLAGRHLELGGVLTRLVADRLGQGVRDGFGDKAVEGYRIIRCVGRGGMSVVYRAQDETTGELVALKMMSYRLIYDAFALARFRQEADLVQQLDHENIARLMRLFPAYHTYFLVMELCEGADVQRIVDFRGPLPEREVRLIVGQLARALGYIHGRGLVHRDLKPANVLITRTGAVKLADFGIAMPVLSANEGQTIAADTGLMGTPVFMAPEQMSGGRLDHRADIYALGGLMYELVVGAPLFTAKNVFELMQQKLTLKLPTREELPGEVSAELYDFMEHALRVNPDERPLLSSVVDWAGLCEPPPEELLTEPPSGPSSSAGSGSGGYRSSTQVNTAIVTGENLQ